jgi:hypothetical protein
MTAPPAQIVAPPVQVAAPPTQVTPPPAQVAVVAPAPAATAAPAPGATTSSSTTAVTAAWVRFPTVVVFMQLVTNMKIQPREGPGQTVWKPEAAKH